MAAPVPPRDDFRASQLRSLARKARDANQSSRLLALAEIYMTAAAAAMRPGAARLNQDRRQLEEIRPKMGPVRQLRSD